MKQETYFIVILLIIAAFLFLFGLGNMALTDPDETFYAQTAKEMFKEGEWNTPLLFGKPQFEKPILYYWLIIFSYAVFGIGEFAARFPSAIFGIAGVIGVYLLGRIMFSPLCGFLSGLIIATCVQYLVLARACVTDMVLTVFILFCILFFLQGWITQKKMCYFISAVMAAFAVLTKGPIGIFIPAVVLLTYILVSGQWKRMKGIPVMRCILIFLAVSLPWYLITMRLHGSVFIDEFFGFHNITRFLEPEHKIGSSPFFYIPVVIGGFFPWSFFLIFGAWDMFKDKNAARSIKAPRAFFLIWFLVVFVFFSVSRTKLVTYIFPLFPAIAVVSGRFWEKFIRDSGTDKNLRLRINAAYAFYAVSALIAAIGVYFLVKYRYTQILPETMAAAAVFLTGMCFAVIFFLRNRKFVSFILIVSSVVLLSVPLVRNILPVIGEYESSKTLSYKINELAKPEDPVGGESDHRRGIAFYTDRTDIVDIHAHSRLQTFFSREERVWGIVQRKHYRQLKEAKGNAVSEPLSESGKYVLITN